ncbi:formate/nitrite transporter family protein [Psychrobacter pacificensis]|uniref:formate/nitrite transporter family protein n=1 Tax=Psychrobacter pacificensis TaxID=112002 RepID=UPI003D074094
MSQNNTPNQSRHQDAQDILPDSERLPASTTNHVQQNDDANDTLNSNHGKDNTEHSYTLQHSHSPENNDTDIHTHSHADDHIKATEELDNDDLPEEISDEDKETIKKVAGDDNLSQAKSYASILVEQVIHAKETFERSLGSLFTSAFTAGLEIGISFFVILSAFALLNDVLPSRYAMVLSSLLYPIGFIIVVIGQSLLFTEQLPTQSTCAKQD